MSERELKPCPFCGNPRMDEDEGCFPVNRDRSIWVVRCGDPNCSAEVEGGSYEAAVASWNRRAITAGASGGGDGWWEGLGNEVIDGEACILYQHTTTGAQLWCRKSEHEKVDALLKGRATPASPAAVEGFTPAGAPQECASVVDAVMLAERALWQDDEGVRWVPEAAYQRMVSEVERMETNIAATPQPAAAQGGEWVSVISGSEYAIGIHTPTVTVSFKRDDWAARDRFAAAMLAAAPQPQAAGDDSDFVRATTPEEDAAIDLAAGLVKVTVRLPIELAERLKDEAAAVGLVFPAYVRQILFARTPPAHGDGEVANPYEAFGFGELAKQDDLTNPTPEAQEAREGVLPFDPPNGSLLTDGPLRFHGTQRQMIVMALRDAYRSGRDSCFYAVGKAADRLVAALAARGEDKP